MKKEKVKLDENLIAKIRRIQMRAKHLVNDSFAGEYQSAFKGRGLEFEEVREYLPGDDIRNIDWNVTARSTAPFIKQFRDERELTVLFMVDVSASSRFGTVQKLKNEIAAELTALLAYTALKNNDKVGLVVFSHEIEHYLPPKKGRGHVWTLIRDILTYQSQAKTTNFHQPLEFLNQVLKKKAIVFLISDFHVEDYENVIRTTAFRHELIAVSIRDRRELSLPSMGYLELEDIETGELILINTSQKKKLQEFETFTQKQKKEQEDFFRSKGIDFVSLKTDSSYLDEMVKFFKKREKRKM